MFESSASWALLCLDLCVSNFLDLSIVLILLLIIIIDAVTKLMVVYELFNYIHATVMYCVLLVVGLMEIVLPYKSTRFPLLLYY